MLKEDFPSVVVLAVGLSLLLFNPGCQGVLDPTGCIVVTRPVSRSCEVRVLVSVYYDNVIRLFRYLKVVRR